MSIYLTLTPRDPLIARDGRPFGYNQGLRMKSLDWPYPSVLAGSLRSLLGKASGGEFEDKTVSQLKQIGIGGPLPFFNKELYFPAPRDLLVYENQTRQRQSMALRPVGFPEGGCCNLPGGLRPVAVTEDVKPAKAPAFWSMATMLRWLLRDDLDTFIPPEQGKPNSGFLDAPDKDERTHVSIKPDTYTADEGMLFKTIGLDMCLDQQAKPLQLAVRVEAKEGKWQEKLKNLHTLHTFGGERRLVRWQVEKPCTAWHCPTELHTVLKGIQRVRLVLATPGVFQQGWLPGWLDARTFQGKPPGTPVQLRLVGACVERWKPISGWGLENGKIGPKPIRRLVPAGSVYFFEVEEGSAAQLTEKCWLRSVADDRQDQLDGFGLALWGLW